MTTGPSSHQPKATIRFDIATAGTQVGGHQLMVYIDGVEMTAKGAGLGIEPFTVLLPENRLRATTTPHQIPIARCECGTYGCGMTDVNIVRNGGCVHWDWLHEVPISHGVTFDAAQYDAEVTRIAAEHSWERPEDTTTRLVITGTDAAALANRGLRLSWTGADHLDPSLFVVSFTTADNNFQVFLRVSRRGRTPDEVADDVLRLLDESPSNWPATFHSVRPKATALPSIAGPQWKRENIGLR